MVPSNAPKPTLMLLREAAAIYGEPDLSYVEGTAEALAPHLRPGKLLVLESTTYPDTTSQLLRSALGKKRPALWGAPFIACFPQREDLGTDVTRP